MTSRILNRAELRTRLAEEAPGWVVDELADAFEPAFLTGQRKAAEAERLRKRRGAKPENPGRRPRPGRPQPEEDDA